MKLQSADVRQFIAREIGQGRHLRKALRGRHQKGKRKLSLKPLRKATAGDLNAHNGHSRSLWFRHIGARLCHHLGATAPKWIPEETTYLLTIVESRDVILDDDKGEFVVSRRLLGDIRSRFASHLIGLSYFGMIDVALHVSTNRAYGVPRLMAVHGHFLVWDSSLSLIKDVCDAVNRKTSSILPYTSPADFRAVKRGDLLQVLWYICKMPRKQYQLWRRTKGRSLKQYKRAINGVNAVRLYEAMEHVTLRQLVMSGGKGYRLLLQAVGDLP